MISVCRQIQYLNIVHMHGCAAIDQEMVLVVECVNGANLHSMLFGKTSTREVSYVITEW